MVQHALHTFGGRRIELPPGGATAASPFVCLNLWRAAKHFSCGGPCLVYAPPTPSVIQPLGLLAVRNPCWLLVQLYQLWGKRTPSALQLKTGVLLPAHACSLGYFAC